jgi:hypothetical protein
MADYEALKTRVQELAERDWDTAAIEDRYRKMAAEGITKKTLDRDEVVANKQQILDRVQQRAEEYNFLARNCARSTALAVMDCQSPISISRLWRDRLDVWRRDRRADRPGALFR